MKRMHSLLAGLGACIALAPAGAPAQTKEIVVGASVALTGKYARTGQEQLNGFQLWVEDVNRRGGLLGRKVRLVYYDDESRPDAGARLYEKLITGDKVDLLIGLNSSGVTLAASTVAERHGFPMVSAGASSSTMWTRGYKNVFGLYTPATTYMDQTLALARDKGLKRVALIHADTAFARDVARGVEASAKRLGLEVVFKEEYGTASTDFAAIILKIKALKADVVVGGSYLPDSTAFMRQAQEYQLYAKIFAFAVGPGLPDFGTKLGAIAEGVMGNSQWELTVNLPGVKTFSKQYEQRYGHVPGYHAAGGYGAGQVLEAAVKIARSFDRAKLRRALLKLDTTTVFGRYKVDATGMQVGKPGYTVQWIGGNRHVILPPSVAAKKTMYPFKPWDKR